MPLEEDIELVDMPNKRGEVKVVQLFLDSAPIMVCSNVGFHSDILQRYLQTNSIEPETTEIDYQQVPVLSGDRYQVVGMGKMQIVTLRPRVLRLPYGRSTTYDLAVNRDFHERLEGQFLGWRLR